MSLSHVVFRGRQHAHEPLPFYGLSNASKDTLLRITDSICQQSLCLRGSRLENNVKFPRVTRQTRTEFDRLVDWSSTGI